MTKVNHCIRTVNITHNVNSYSAIAEPWANRQRVESFQVLTVEDEKFVARDVIINR